MDSDKIVNGIAALIKAIGMYSHNQDRLACGLSVAYTDHAFTELAETLVTDAPGLDAPDTDAHTSNTLTFADGYYCALSRLLRHTGQVTPFLEELFKSGAPKEEITDPVDISVFRTYGLME